MTLRGIPTTTENNSKLKARKRDDAGKAVQLEFPEILLDCPTRGEAFGGRAVCVGDADIISKSDLAMMRGRRKKYDQQKRNER